MEPATNDRRIVHFLDLGIPDVESLGRYDYHVVQPGLNNHSHPGAVEISYLVRGFQTYRVGGKEYRLVGGDLFITGQESRTIQLDSLAHFTG